MVFKIIYSVIALIAIAGIVQAGPRRAARLQQKTGSCQAASCSAPAAAPVAAKCSIINGKRSCP